MSEPRSSIPAVLRHTPTIKVILLGDLGVGKTCLRAQFIHHVFSAAYKTTIGGDFLTTTVEVPNEETSETIKINLQVWDTAGQERYNLISQAFYRGADVAMLIYDTTNYESLISLRRWWSQFFEHCHVDSPGVVIVGTKTDKTADRCIDLEEVKPILCRNDTNKLDPFVANWATDVIELSCKQLGPVEAAFQRVAMLGLKKSSQNEVSRSKMKTIDSSIMGAMETTSSLCAC